MSNHTPGPWTISEGQSDIGIVIVRTLVAMVTNDEDWPISLEEQQANACLIAAAPDLLAALERIANTNSTNAAELKVWANAAIAAAKGEA